MKISKWLLVMAAALALVACDARDRRLPNLNDANASADVATTLSPWKDGSPDRSPDGRALGDYDGDRQTFIRWYLRWAAYEDAHQHDRDYQPFEVPSTIGAALDQQRAYERDRKAKSDNAASERAAKEARAEAAEELTRRQAEQQRAVEEAETAAKRAEEQQQWEVQKQVNAECRKRRQVAADDWLRGGPTTSKGMYSEVWASFKCGEQ